MPLLKSRLKAKPVALAYHPFCTLQHPEAQGGVEAALCELGFKIDCASNDSHPCCGSAATYGAAAGARQATAMDAHNSVQQPQAVVPAPFSAQAGPQGLVLYLPPQILVVVGM